jgi:hypothetical protein
MATVEEFQDMHVDGMVVALVRDPNHRLLLMVRSRPHHSWRHAELALPTMFPLHEWTNPMTTTTRGGSR